MNFTRIVIKPSENEDYRYRLFKRYRYTSSIGVKPTKESEDFEEKLLQTFGNKAEYSKDGYWFSRICIKDRSILSVIGLENEQGEFLSLSDYFHINSMSLKSYGKNRGTVLSGYNLKLADGDTLHGLEFDAEEVYNNVDEFLYIQIYIHTSTIKDEDKLITDEERDIISKRVNFPKLIIKDTNDNINKIKFEEHKPIGYGFNYAAINEDTENKLKELLNEYSIEYRDICQETYIRFYSEESLHKIGFEDTNGNIIYLIDYIKEHWTEEIAKEDKIVANGGISTINKEDIDTPSENMEDDLSKGLSMMFEREWRREDEIIIENIDLLQGLKFDISKVYGKKCQYIQLKIIRSFIEDKEAFDFNFDSEKDKTKV